MRMQGRTKRQKKRIWKLCTTPESNFPFLFLFHKSQLKKGKFPLAETIYS
jgi:hypothetical protein